jgi:mRNA interferase HigB
LQPFAQSQPELEGRATQWAAGLVRSPELIAPGFCFDCSQNGSIIQLLRVISHRAIVDFGRTHTDSLAPLNAWYHTTLRAEWRNFAELREVFPHADQVDRCTVFNIGGNKYRLIARVNYETQKAFVLKILTHPEYTRGAWKRLCIGGKQYRPIARVNYKTRRRLC